MGFGSIWHWLIVLAIVLILFGRGRVAEIMGDFGKGIKSFKDGMGEHDKPSARIEGPVQDAKPVAETPADPQPAPRSDTQA